MVTVARETLVYIGWMIFFTGAMLTITPTVNVAQGNLPDPIYLTVGKAELVGVLVVIFGIYLILRNR